MPGGVGSPTLQLPSKSAVQLVVMKVQVTGVASAGIAVTIRRVAAAGAINLFMASSPALDAHHNRDLGLPQRERDKPQSDGRFADEIELRLADVREGEIELAGGVFLDAPTRKCRRARPSLQGGRRR